jgi:drug/metabolite transporter (DMT)-like permease
MDWLIFALIGTVLYSAGGLLDKLIMGSYIEDSKAYVVCQVLVSQLFTIPLIMVIGMDFVYPESLFALFIGVLQVLPGIFYIRALKVEEASKVNALEGMHLLPVLLGSIFILGETLTLKNYAGGMMLLAGALLITYKHNNSSGLSCLSPAVRPIIAYSIFTAVYLLSMKYLLTSIDEWHLYTWSSIGTLIAVLPLMGIQSTRHEVRYFFGKGKSAIFALISCETLMFLGIICSIFAYAFGSVTLVTSVSVLQPIMTLLLVLVLGLFMPEIVKKMNENTDNKSMMRKCLSFLIMLVGIYFIG